MSFSIAILFVLLPAACAFAWILGGRTERRGAALYVAYFSADVVYHSIGSQADFSRIMIGHVVLDALLLLGLSYIALNSHKVWPLISAALAFLPIGAHLTVALAFNGMQRAYWMMTQLPAIFGVCTLLVGSIMFARFLRSQERKKINQI